MDDVTLGERVRATYRSLRNGRTSAPIARHVLGTYSSLRLGLGWLAALFPIVLVGSGMLQGIELQHSMSAYFFAAREGQCIFFPTRTFFVGILFAISSGLYLYKGFTALENWLLNAAAICGFVVALVPEHLDANRVVACLKPIAESQAGHLPLHFAAAVLMFVLLGAVAWFCADKTLAYLPAEYRHLERRYRFRYRSMALYMFAVGPSAFVLTALHWNYTVFAAEASGIWIFAWYWFVKSRELALSDGELKAVRLRLAPHDGDAGKPEILRAKVAA